MTNDEYFYELLRETKDRYNDVSFKEVKIEKAEEEEKEKPKNKRYNGSWRNWIVDMEMEISLKRKFEPIDELTLEIEPTICNKFGCGKELSLTEKLAGNFCINHMGKNKVTFFNTKL